VDEVVQMKLLNHPNKVVHVKEGFSQVVDELIQKYLGSVYSKYNKYITL
jgi:hypothetical protein